MKPILHAQTNNSQPTKGQIRQAKTNVAEVQTRERNRKTNRYESIIACFVGAESSANSEAAGFGPGRCSRPNPE